ncbi:MAG: hypothetical protein A3B88_04440 [Candidatus Zambryskibacteria bacterium RIFCSPHIGHO2_02_FULL_39_19]|nr:MAG: hypothetical protein A3B88_04440 [Candidatus Zambryskibacteria bacterium RIFCSPHIGHO2_02_FULL_39_19]
MTPYVTNFNRKVMNDTITLKLSRKDFVILKPLDWQPQLPDVITPTSAPYLPFYYPFHLNKKDPVKYYPKLTLLSYADKATQQPRIELTVDFSAPKILFNNNVDEIEENDFDNLISTLQSRLQEMGVDTTYEAIKKSKVYKLDFSKNILLTNYETVSNATRTIKRFDIPKRLKIYNDRFQNEGHALRIYNTQQQIVVYDKVKDSFKNKDEAEDKVKTSYQQKLLKAIQSHRNPIEILRLEVRILNKRKLNSLLQSLGYAQNPTLKDIFKRDIAQVVLKHYWKLITPDNSQFLLHYTDADTHKQVETYLHTHNITNIKFIEALGIAKLIDDSKKYGIRDIELTSYINFSTRTWLRNEHYFDLINDVVKENSKSNFLEDVNKSLEVFEPFKISSLSESVGLTFDYEMLRH